MIWSSAISGHIQTYKELCQSLKTQLHMLASHGKKLPTKVNWWWEYKGVTENRKLSKLSVLEKETEGCLHIRYELMSKREWWADGGQKEVMPCSSATWLLPYQRLFRKVPGIESGS